MVALNFKYKFFFIVAFIQIVLSEQQELQGEIKNENGSKDGSITLDRGIKKDDDVVANAHSPDKDKVQNPKLQTLTNSSAGNVNQPQNFGAPPYFGGPFLYPPPIHSSFMAPLVSTDSARNRMDSYNANLDSNESNDIESRENYENFNRRQGVQIDPEDLLTLMESSRIMSQLLSAYFFSANSMFQPPILNGQFGPTSNTNQPGYYEDLKKDGYVGSPSTYPPVGVLQPPPSLMGYHMMPFSPLPPPPFLFPNINMQAKKVERKVEGPYEHSTYYFETDPNIPHVKGERVVHITKPVTPNDQQRDIKNADNETKETKDISHEKDKSLSQENDKSAKYNNQI